MRSAIARACLLAVPGAACLVLLAGALSSLLAASLADGLGQYARFVGDPTYLAYLVRSFRVAFYTTVVAALLGYPTGYVMSRVGPRTRRLLMLALMLQFFSVNVTRIYALILILGNNGVVNRSLLALGLVDWPIRLIYNELGVTIGLVSAALPFAVFPIYSVLGRIAPSLAEAARTLGADQTLIFWRITLPLTVPALASSIVIVFLYSLGAFATPVLLGGGFVDLIAVFSYEQAINLASYGFAAAGAVVTLGCAFVLVYAFNRAVEAWSRV
jgi:ABC-type spermidine/putrescine transport system permease subunit I